MEQTLHVQMRIELGNVVIAAANSCECHKVDSLSSAVALLGELEKKSILRRKTLWKNREQPRGNIPGLCAAVASTS